MTSTRIVAAFACLLSAGTIHAQNANIRAAHPAAGLELATVLPVSVFADADKAPVALPSADEVMAQAKTQAAGQHKKILLVFSASWCGPCHMFEALLDDPKTGPILARSFVAARLDVGERPTDKKHANSPGAETLMASLEGKNAGYPFIVMMDEQAKPIVNSLRPIPNKRPENIGYPATREEIDWFMQMLAKASPEITPGDAKTIRHWLDDRGRP